MTPKNIPLTHEQLEALTQRWPTPFHIYDEFAIRTNARRLKAAFAWNPRFRNYFAVKACPNPFLIAILKDEGFGADCSSAPELLLAQETGITGQHIMFTSNDTPAEEFILAATMGANINLDDITHIPFLEQTLGTLPPLVSLRYNPGPLKGGNAIIGKPEEAKYGLTLPQLIQAYTLLKEKGITRFGIHTMVASNELDPQYFIDTATLLFDLMVKIQNQIGITFEFVNLGGGIGIPYHPDQQAVDLERIGQGIRQAYQDRLIAQGHPQTALYLECGRMVTGPYGYLISRIRHLKNTYKNYIGLDASMANLMRPALYGAYHHITLAGKENTPPAANYDVTGSLCENNDKFAINRPLPPPAIGDLVIIHDAGAHGHAMGFQYNGKLRSAELLLTTSGQVIEIRRAETVGDYFATLDFKALKLFTATL